MHDSFIFQFLTEKNGALVFFYAPLNFKTNKHDGNKKTSFFCKYFKHPNEQYIF